MQCIRFPKLPSLGFRVFGVCCCSLSYIKIQLEFFSKQKSANFEIAFFKKSRKFYFKNRLMYILPKLHTCLNMYSQCVWVFISTKYVITKNLQRKRIMGLLCSFPIQRYRCVQIHLCAYICTHMRNDSYCVNHIQNSIYLTSVEHL